MSTNKEIVLADWDGTASTHPELKGEIDGIVTGNPWLSYDDIIDDMPQIPIFWNPGKEELMEIVNHKANVINKTGATKFFEDQPMQVQMLKALCPHARIVLVKEGQTAI